MIQRKQTIFLLIASLLYILPFFLPFVTFVNEFHSFSLTAMGFTQELPDAIGEYEAFPMMVSLIINIILPLIIIFMYKNRKKQIRFCKIGMVVQVLMIGYITLIIYTNNISIESSGLLDFNIGISSFIPIVSLVFILLARIYIKKDDELVRSVDRIR